MLHSPPLRQVALAVLLLASALQGGCRPLPAKAWRIHAYLGRHIQDFLATGPRPLSIVAEPGTGGRTFVFECQSVDFVAVPDPRPPAGEPRVNDPCFPARPGHRPLQPYSMQPLVPRDTPRSRMVLRSYLLRVATDATGIIRSFTLDEEPALP